MKRKKNKRHHKPKRWGLNYAMSQFATSVRNFLNREPERFNTPERRIPYRLFVFKNRLLKNRKYEVYNFEAKKYIKKNAWRYGIIEHG